MSRTPTSEPIDDRLRQLLAVDERLQQRIAEARETGDRRVAEARAAGARRLAALGEGIARANDEQARLDQIAHERTLAAIDAAHRSALAALASVSDRTIDALARRAVEATLDVEKGRP